jgi:hypothetical protein
MYLYITKNSILTLNIHEVHQISDYLTFVRNRQINMSTMIDLLVCHQTATLTS